jgi:uncharacterized protein (TIGR03435 family)
LLPGCDMRRAVAGLMCCAVAIIANTVTHACTAFCAVGRDQVLVGNNEDWNNPSTRLWFVPGKSGSYGRMYVGFNDLTPQGGMNEHGLWFDGFAADPISAAGSADLPSFPGNIVDTAMAECRTVAEVVRLFGRYNRNFLAEGILMFADASGDAVSIERNAMVRKTRGHFVQTNFHQSRSGQRGKDRFDTASSMLEAAREDVSIDLFRRILAATHQKGGYPTLYSNIYDLRSRTMHLYYFHDFDRVVTFNLADELKKGSRVLDIRALFPKNTEADAFAARRTGEAGTRGGGLAFAIVSLVLFCSVVILSGYGLARANRRVRVGVALLAGIVIVAIAGTVIAVREQRRASPAWIQFSIAPASGESASISTTTIRANGMTLKGAIATAYDIPAVRVIGPPWLGDTRYSINAVLGIDKAENFRPLLQEELRKRLGLETHVESRPFDVFVLTPADSPRLEHSAGSGPSTWISKQDVRMRGGSIQDLASAIQAILGRPVIDETGIRGSYDMEFGWSGERVASVTATLRDRFGLRLSPGTRDMETLIVDRIRRDPALVLFDQVGRITRAAPAPVRQRIADVLTMR